MNSFIKVIYALLIIGIVGLIVYLIIKLVGIGKSLSKTSESLNSLNENIQQMDTKKQKIEETKQKLASLVSALAIVSIIREFSRNYKSSKKLGKTVRKTLVSNAGKIAKINIK